MTTASRWALLVSAVAITGLVLVLLFLLSIATNNRGLYEQHYVWLFWVNVGVATLLLLVIGGAALRLAVRMQRGKFGSRLLFKLAAIFALVGVIPGALIYTVSFQFVSRSIETWFDARVDSALEAGLNLGRGAIDAQAADLSIKTRVAAERLGESTSLMRVLDLERLREQLAVQELVVLAANGQPLMAVGAASREGSAVVLRPDRPAAATLRQARSQRVASLVEGLDEDPAGGSREVAARVRTVAFIPSAAVSLGSDERYLMAVQSLPPSLAANALAVQTAYREYQQRSLARDGLRRMYIGTLTLSLVLAVFAAVLLAVALGNQLARPLLLLADGVQQVSRGDLSAKPVFASNDELGGLTRSFADMTQQLADARDLVQRSVSQVESARTNLQTILDNLTAGVIVFDAAGRIDTVNPGATRILRLPLSAYRGQGLVAVPGLADFAVAVKRRFEQHRTSPEAGERDHWQDAFELPATPGSPALSNPATAAGGPPAVSTLLLRGAALPQGAQLLVFDDITEVVSAQRAQAWSEVARRLAHEIKNPLTPIQLSAERLAHRLENKLEGNDRAMLTRSVQTIVAQVQAMKTLVNEFRDYARLPTAQLEPLDLNALCGEVIALYGHGEALLSTQSLAAPAHPLVVNLAADLPWIQGDSTQLRQVIHNLLQNAFDAVAEVPDGLVELVTEPLRDDHGQLRGVRLRVCDNGPGIAESVLQRAFEPYVTTKSKGTGLGLAVVKKIADEHEARLRLTNLPAPAGSAARAGGAQVSLSFSRWVPASVRPSS
jgi:nitrogen fixation/metabolism regulation signal transduction histidine kinase